MWCLSVLYDNVHPRETIVTPFHYGYAMRQSYLPFSVARSLSLAWIVLLAAACAASPTTSRTGAIHDVTVTEGPDPADLMVNPGDEVRWVNSRTASIQIDLVKTNPELLSCNRGFSDFLGFPRAFAELSAGETASACFVLTGDVQYNLRMESALPGGMKFVSGVIRVRTTP